MAEPKPQRPPKFTALVLAAQRGPDDSLAKLSPQGHKCLLPIAGRSMIERVVGALMATQEIGSIAISIERPEVIENIPGFDALLARGRLSILNSAASPSLSVAQALEDLENPYPLLVTTADHALLSPSMLRHFCREARDKEADIIAGLASEATVTSAFPESKRTYLKFRGGRYSGCNLFACLTPEAKQAIAFWRRVEQERKHPWRIARAFGFGLLLAYGLRLFTLDQAMKRASGRLGCRAAAVEMPYAEAAVDVDRPEDIEVVEQRLRG